MKKFVEFREAREHVKSLGIKGQKEYHELRKSGQIPHSLPSAPYKTYKGKGWKGWSDFLGTGNIATINREFLPFEEAREFVRSLGFKGQKEWQEYSKSGQRPHNIPSAPHATYKGKGWKDIGDWLGNRTRREYLPFEEAREFARSLILKNLREWKKYSKSGQRPRYISSAPDLTYKGKGWKGWGDFLGTGNVATFNKKIRPFEEAREFVRSLGIKNWESWREYSKSGQKPHDIPSVPNRTYKGKGWKGWGDFLGNIKESYTLTKEEVKVVKDMNKVDSTLSKINSTFNQSGFSKEK